MTKNGQLEIEYFWPLTEQIVLDLDFTPCKEYQDEKQRQLLAQSVVSSGQFLMANGGSIGSTWATIDTNNVFAFRPEPDAVGYWQISKDMQVWRKQRPNWLHQKMTKFFFGWEWKDK